MQIHIVLLLDKLFEGCSLLKDILVLQILQILLIASVRRHSVWLLLIHITIAILVLIDAAILVIALVVSRIIEIIPAGRHRHDRFGHNSWLSCFESTHLINESGALA